MGEMMEFHLISKERYDKIQENMAKEGTLVNPDYPYATVASTGDGEYALVIFNDQSERDNFLKYFTWSIPVTAVMVSGNSFPLYVTVDGITLKYSHSEDYQGFYRNGGHLLRMYACDDAFIASISWRADPDDDGIRHIGYSGREAA